jgi:hypothetical protein
MGLLDATGRSLDAASREAATLSLDAAEHA